MHQLRIYDHVMACINALTVVKEVYSYSHALTTVKIAFILLFIVVLLFIAILLFIVML